MIPDRIRAVFFDAVGTVLHPEPGAPTVYAREAERFGLAIAPDEILARFRAAYLLEETVDELADWTTSEARERKRWQAIVSATLPGAPSECFDALFAHFAQPQAWSAPPGIEAVLDRLAERGLRLGLASNYDSRLSLVLAGRPELQRLLGHVVISSHVGVRKPGRGFFQRVIEGAGCPPEQIAFVGDDIDNDYRGAERAGMLALLLDPNERHPQIERRIRTLEELIGIQTTFAARSAITA